MNNNGLLDTSLNSSGFYAFNLVPNSWDYFRDIIVNEDESFHVIGYSSGFISSFYFRVYNKNKRMEIDFNFNGNGYHHTNFKKLMIHHSVEVLDKKMVKFYYMVVLVFNVTAGTVRIIDDTFYQL